MTDKKKKYKSLFLYSSLIVVLMMTIGLLTFYENKLDERIHYPIFEHEFFSLLIEGDVKTLDDFLKKNERYIPYLFEEQHPHIGGMIALRALELMVRKNDYEKLEVLLRYFLPKFPKNLLASLLLTTVYVNSKKK